MNPEVRTRWLAALRSGRYQQARGKLTRLERDALSGEVLVTHCCLGVLCAEAIAAGIDVTTYDRDGRREYGYEGNDNWLPLEVRRWADLDTGNPTVTFHYMITPLADLNDDRRLTFAQLADLIEADERL